jgi:hypothetical protein
MNLIRAAVFRWAVVSGVAIWLAGGAQAALITPFGNEIAGLEIALTMTPETDTAGGSTTLYYDVALAPDTAAEWLVVGFTVLRDWTEGPYTGSPASRDRRAGW